MTGLDRLSYQSRWLHVAPERKFLFWLLLMVLAFSLPPLGQALLMACTAAFTCWLLRHLSLALVPLDGAAARVSAGGSGDDRV